jgi:maltose O-acetyltransferase
MPIRKENSVADLRSQRERLLAGDLHIADDPELARDSLRATRLMAKFNQGTADSPGERQAIVKELLDREVQVAVC